MPCFEPSGTGGRIRNKDLNPVNFYFIVSAQHMTFPCMICIRNVLASCSLVDYNILSPRSSIHLSSRVGASQIHSAYPYYSAYRCHSMNSLA